MAKRSLWLRWLANAALVVGSIGVMLVVGELGLRLYFYRSLAAPQYTPQFYQPHPKLGWVLKPNARARQQELDFSVRVEINSKGLRDREHDYEKTPGVHRILLVSDSAMFGSGVELEQTIPARLGGLLGDGVELINLSLPAYSTVQEYVLFLEEGRKYRPDVVLLGFSPSNDVQTNYLPLQRLYQKKQRRPYASLDPATGTLVIDHEFARAEERRMREEAQQQDELHAFFADTVTARLCDGFRKKFKPGKRDDPNIFIGWPFLKAFAPQHGLHGMKAEEYETLWRAGWQVTIAMIDAMKKDAEDGGARFALFVAPSKLQVEPRHRDRVLEAFPGLQLDPEKIPREIAAYGSANRIPVLDILPDVVAADAARGGGLYFDFEDEHLTAAGSAVVAEALAREMAEKGLLGASAN